MELLKEIFKIEVSSNKLRAMIHIRDHEHEKINDLSLTKEKLEQFLQAHKISYGIRYDTIDTIIESFPKTKFPLCIAEGRDKIDGENGTIEYFFDTETDLSRTIKENEPLDFRNIMKIPTVEKNEKLAKIIPATKGKHGKTIYRTTIKSRPGRQVQLRPGKNVIFNEETNEFYAAIQGQVSIINQRIHVLDVYEVNESVSMKIGNIDFPGTVIIRGDVPTGFTVKATGDIKIFGIVEAAKVIAGGSVMVSEGIAGLGSGKIEAGENVEIGYINQGIVQAGKNIIVENSIMHGQCLARENIVCLRGNIVGGMVSAGAAVQMNHAGNRMNTKTKLAFGMDDELLKRQGEIEEELNVAQDNYKKLMTLQDKYQELDRANLNRKLRITLLRLQYSIEKSKDTISKLKEELVSIQASLGDIKRAYIKVNGTIYPNVIVQFGRYQRTIDKEYTDVMIVSDKKDLSIRSSFNAF